MSSARGMVMRVRYRPIASASSEAGTLSFGRGSDTADGHRVVVEAGNRSMRTYYKQSYRPNPLGAVKPELQALMLQYAKAGVLSHPMGGLRHATKHVNHERSHAQVTRDKKMFVAQGLTNNTTMRGMKHQKNQSLMY